MNAPNPALVTQRAATRLPRPLLLLFCAAWVIPGLLGRDPWRNADVTAFGVMNAIAQGRTSWLAPALGGVAVDAAPLPHALGALFIALLSPYIDPALAARLPFALALTLTLAGVWYTTFHLARTEAAQPVAFAFGGEAAPVDYARAIADGATLALIATLGLLQLGHETTPELIQLLATTLYLWALAAAPFRGLRARCAAVAALLMLVTSGAPTVALVFGLTGTVICSRSSYERGRALAAWLFGATVLSAGLASALGAWVWRFDFEAQPAQLMQIVRQWAWFMWPAWPLALWTLWRWRGQLLNRHVAVPLGTVVAAAAASAWMGGDDRALLLALPGLAVLAAFALPTLKRSTAAAIDWFSLCFFTTAAVFIWVMYVAMQSGVPSKPAANIAKLAVGFEATFSAWALAWAIGGTLAWIGLVRWRTGRHRHALWKSLVIPAGGVALCWLLLMTLWLPLLDYARSARPLVARIAPFLKESGCVLAPGLSPALVASLEVFSEIPVDARPGQEGDSPCKTLLKATRQVPTEIPGWALSGSVRRPTDRTESVLIYQRVPAPPR